MDLVSSIRKSGSRGGVNFSWDEVASSSHRENYLWAQSESPGWANDGTGAPTDETEEERAERERREEIKKVKEAEEDAIAKALGLPPPVRSQSGANSVEIAKPRLGPEEEKDTETQTDIIGGGTEATATAGKGSMIEDATDRQETEEDVHAMNATNALDEMVAIRGEQQTGAAIESGMVITRGARGRKRVVRALTMTIARGVGEVMGVIDRPAPRTSRGTVKQGEGPGLEARGRGKGVEVLLVMRGEFERLRIIMTAREQRP
ncbi:kinase phosphorylation protein [Apiospora kogelbergensis]|uniref:kinase phosphorylation protein n=1 Tax=Apiospora kogelbergensis TaxID=1337665 RepID=UPI00312DF616